MTTLHTLGPWKHHADRDQITSQHPESSGSLIAKIATGENREEEDANAALIAAAPELLEAAILARKYVKLAGNAINDSVRFELDRVIALATGQAKAEGVAQ